MLRILKTLKQDQWYGEAVLSLLKHAPSSAQIEILSGHGSQLVIHVDKLTILLKRGSNRTSKKLKRLGSWRCTFSFPVQNLLGKERELGRQVVVLMVCHKGPIIAFDYPDSIGSKNYCYVSSIKRVNYSSSNTLLYSVSGVVASKAKRPDPARIFWGRILKMNIGA